MFFFCGRRECKDGGNLPTSNYEMSQEKTKITTDLRETEKKIRELFYHCDDIKIRTMKLGEKRSCDCLLAYIEVNVKNMMLEQSALGRLISFLQRVKEEDLYQALEENAAGLSDTFIYRTIEEAAAGVMIGDAILFLDGFAGAIKIPDKGYPGLNVKEGNTEKVVRGSNENFCDSEKVNTALIRRRIRSTRLKVEEIRVGIRSHTNVAIVYIEDIVHPGLVNETKKRLNKYEMDAVLDSGVLEQLAEKNWLTPFPQFQTTRRPDRAAMSVLEGKVVVLVDNSPVALLLPTDINSFLKTTDDYYNRFQMASFERILRYIAAFFSLSLPGLYLALTNFHTQILPTPLLLSFWEARLGVPFPAVLEVILMEISFELLREAGVRLPGMLGSTIGIVGGLIIGDAAVQANLVSPIVVIVVAFTALCSFTIPNEEFSFALRLLKFFVIILSAWLGYFGFLVSLFIILIHLAGLKSFGFPYLTPYVGAQLNGYQDEKDSIIRFPLWFLWKRPIYANDAERIKLKRKD